MASESANKANDIGTLSTIFKDGLYLYNNLGRIDEPTNSSSVQANVKRATHLLEDATRLVSLAGLFSTNEGIDEVATNDIQYLLLPALLGSLILKLTSGDRKEIINVAEVYFKDYLKRCNDYGLSNYVFKQEKEENTTTNENKSEIELIQSSINIRASKIQKFQEQKELEKKLDSLSKNMENEHVDEEIKRNYFLTMIKLYIGKAISELHDIEMEKPLIAYRASLGDDMISVPKKLPVKPLAPVIITRDEIQKAVFGAGYPSLPTMTVKEFYDKRVRDGIFPGPASKSSGPASIQEAAVSGVQLNYEDEDIKREEFIENDDPELLEQMRRKDEFKDEHRRGWGNRMNRS